MVNIKLNLSFTVILHWEKIHFITLVQKLIGASADYITDVSRVPYLSEVLSSVVTKWQRPQKVSNFYLNWFLVALKDIDLFSSKNFVFK